MIGSANRNADPLSPRVLSNGHLVRNLSSRGYSRTNARPPLAEESTAPNVRNPSPPPEGGRTLTILSSPRVVDAALSSRIDQALFIESGLHAGRYNNRARRQSQFLDGSDMV